MKMTFVCHGCKKSQVKVDHKVRGDVQAKPIPPPLEKGWLVMNLWVQDEKTGVIRQTTLYACNEKCAQKLRDAESPEGNEELRYIGDFGVEKKSPIIVPH